MTRQIYRTPLLYCALVAIAYAPLASQVEPTLDAQEETIVVNTSERFVDNGDGTVSDTATGLTWLKDASCAELAGTDAEGRADWDTAVSAVAALQSGQCGLADGSQAGDWRLPEIEEFCSSWAGSEHWCTETDAVDSLLDPRAGVPSVPLASASGEGEIFLFVEKDRYWSGTAKFHNVAWFADLAKGWVFYAYKADAELFVWPVRSSR